MARRLIFSVRTPLGHNVVLTRDRWRQITRFKHPALTGRENDVRACLATPTLVRESAKEPRVHLYYAIAGDLFLCVVPHQPPRTTTLS
jgi:hypothetical protein